MRTKRKRLLNNVLLILSMIVLCFGLTSGILVDTRPVFAEEKAEQTEDWMDEVDDQVILDDPKYFTVPDDAEQEAAEIENAAELSQDESSASDATPDDNPDTSDLDSSEDLTEETAPPDTESTETPPVDASNTPTDEPTASPEPTKEPVDLKTLFSVQIKTPAGWTNAASGKVRIQIRPLSSVLWEKVQYRLDNGEWIVIVDQFTLLDGYYYVDVPLRENAEMGVRLLDANGNCLEVKKAIALFDRTPPVVTAGIKDQLLHVDAPDDLSGTAGVQVNGLLFTTLENGCMDVRMEDVLLTYPQLAIRAYDYAGNFSEPIILDNPYYSAPTATPKPTAKPTKKPTATAAPTSRPTKKPSGGSHNPTKAPNTTKVPASTAVPEATQEPAIIYVTQQPQPTPEPVKETVYIPLGPGQPYTNDGNMQTLDMLYSASTNKQFITVQSRNGQTYYLIIDYDKPIDEANEIYETYFLNLVDDRDLMSVLTDSEIIATPTPQIVYVTPEPTNVPTTTAAPMPQLEPKLDSSQVGIMLLFIFAAGSGLVWFFIKKKKAGKQTLRMMDESGFDDDDDEPENNE